MTKRTKAYFDALTGVGAFTETALDDLTDSVAFKVDGASGTDTGAVQLPLGTTAQRPGTPVEGMCRMNSDTDALEFYDGAAWVAASIEWEENGVHLRPVTDGVSDLGDATHQVKDAYVDGYVYIAGTKLTGQMTCALSQVSATMVVKARAHRAFTIKNVYAIRTGGTSSDINVTAAGSDVLGADYTTTTSWATPGASSVAVAAGAALTFDVTAISGAQDISIQIVYEYT